MRSVSILSAILATGASIVSAQSSCSDDIVVRDLNMKIDCDVVDGKITIDENLAGSLTLDGPKQIKQDLIIRNATKLIGITSTTINSVGGTLEMTGLQLLSTFNMQSLTEVGTLKFQNLPQLSQMTLGSKGVSEAKSIIITDTFISDLSGLNIGQADTIDISNNGKLTKFNSMLTNVTSLKLTNNGNNMQVNMSELESAKEIQFRQVKSFDAPALSRVGSIKFNDSPELLSVSADNLTNIDASLTLINNKKLTKLSFKSLVTVKGDMTIQNNTDLKQIDGFPKVATVGTLLLRGNFENVSMPSLNDVQGSATASSTTDISAFCGFFDGLKKDAKIRGKESCSSNNKDANSGGSGGTSGSGDQNAAGFVSVNSALLGLAAFAAFAQLL